MPYIRVTYDNGEFQVYQGASLGETPEEQVRLRYWDYDDTMRNGEEWLSPAILAFLIQHQGPSRGIIDSLCSQGVAMPGAKPHLTFDALRELFAESSSLFTQATWHQDTVGNESLATHPESRQFYQIALSFAGILVAELVKFADVRSKEELTQVFLAEIDEEIKSKLDLQERKKDSKFNRDEAETLLRSTQQSRAEAKANKVIAEREPLQAKWLAFFCPRAEAESNEAYQARRVRFQEHVQHLARSQPQAEWMDPNILTELQPYWLEQRKPGLTLMERSYEMFKHSLDALGVTLEDLRHLIKLMIFLKESSYKVKETSSPSVVSDLEAFIGTLQTHLNSGLSLKDALFEMYLLKNPYESWCQRIVVEADRTPEKYKADYLPGFDIMYQRVMGNTQDLRFDRAGQYLAIFNKFHPRTAYTSYEKQRKDALAAWSGFSKLNNDSLLVMLFLNQLNTSKATFMLATERHLQLAGQLPKGPVSRVFIDDISGYAETPEHAALGVIFVLSAVKAADPVERYIQLALLQTTPLQLYANLMLHQETPGVHLPGVPEMMSHGLLSAACLAVHGGEFKSAAMNACIAQMKIELDDAERAIIAERRKQGDMTVFASLAKKILSYWARHPEVFSNEFLSQLQSAVTFKNGFNFENEAEALTRLCLLMLSEAFGTDLALVTGFPEYLKSLALSNDPEYSWARTQLGDVPPQLQKALAFEISQLPGRVPAVSLLNQTRSSARVSQSRRPTRQDREEFDEDLGDSRIAVEFPPQVALPATCLGDLQAGFSRRDMFSIILNDLPNILTQLRDYLIQSMRMQSHAVVDVIVLSEDNNCFRVDSIGVLTYEESDGLVTESDDVRYYSLNKRGELQADKLIPHKPLARIETVRSGEILECKVSFTALPLGLCLGQNNPCSIAQPALPDCSGQLIQNPADPLVRFYETVRQLIATDDLDMTDRNILEMIAWTVLPRILAPAPDSWPGLCEDMQRFMACKGSVNLAGVIARRYESAETVFRCALGIATLVAQFQLPLWLLDKLVIESDHELFGATLDPMNEGVVAAAILTVSISGWLLGGFVFDRLRARQAISLMNDNIAPRDVGRLLQSRQPLPRDLAEFLRSTQDSDLTPKVEVFDLLARLCADDTWLPGNLRCVLRDSTIFQASVDRAAVQAFVEQRMRASAFHERHQGLRRAVTVGALLAPLGYFLYLFITGVQAINSSGVKGFDDHLQRTWTQMMFWVTFFVESAATAVVAATLPKLINYLAEAIARWQARPIHLGLSLPDGQYGRFGFASSELSRLQQPLLGPEQSESQAEDDSHSISYAGF